LLTKNCEIINLFFSVNFNLKNTNREQTVGISELQLGLNTLNKL